VEHPQRVLRRMLGSGLSGDQAGEIQPDGQTFTHIGESFSPSHSVHLLASMVKNTLPLLIALVGQIGRQSSQAVHWSGSIYIAMMFS
jgi:hypothetical protein